MLDLFYVLFSKGKKSAFMKQKSLFGANIYPSLVVTESSALSELSTLSEFKSHDSSIEVIIELNVSSISLIASKFDESSDPPTFLCVLKDIDRVKIRSFYFMYNCNRTIFTHWDMKQNTS